MSEQELEVKFYVCHLEDLERRLRSQGASLAAPRSHEYNLRFDTPGSDLGRESRVLRLRQDAKAALTFKGPTQDIQGVNVRQEIEFDVSDFTAARHLLEALGYQVILIYEKYRATYHLDNVLVTLDEMPFGSFAEVEGPDVASIRECASRLGLDWARRCGGTYISIFQQIKQSRGYAFRDLTFANFASLSLSAEDLGVHPAD